MNPWPAEALAKVAHPLRKERENRSNYGYGSFYFPVGKNAKIANKIRTIAGIIQIASSFANFIGLRA